MITTELKSSHAQWLDLLFFMNVCRRLIQKMESQGVAELIDRTFTPVGGVDLAVVVKGESELLSKYKEVEVFLRSGNSRLSDLIPKPKDKRALKGKLRSQPAFLCEWNAASRRVFQLGSETQKLLEMTEFEELELDDVVVPFPNFLVRLAEPMRVFGRPYGTIGFSEVVFAQETRSTTEGWAFLLFPAGTYEPFPSAQKENILKGIDGNHKRRNEAMASLLSLVPPVHGVLEAFAPLNGSAVPRISTSEFDNCQEFMEVTQKVHTIMINLMAIMGRLGKRGSRTSVNNTGGHAEVMSAVNVFDLSTMNSLEGALEAGRSREESGYVADLSKRRIAPHWRRKHHRRHPGMGHLPDAPRDVKVPATLVLGDFLPVGSLPIGTITKI